MVVMPATVISHCHWVLGDILANVLDTHFFSVGSGNCIIQISNVCLVMFSVMDLHRFCIDVWL